MSEPSKNAKHDTPVFSPKLFGELIRRKRREAGFSNAEKFHSAIKERTGVNICKDTIHLIERGERTPSLSKTVAIFFTLYGLDWPKHIGEDLRSCSSMRLIKNEARTLADDLLDNDEGLINTLINAGAIDRDEISGKLASLLSEARIDVRDLERGEITSEDLDEFASNHFNKYVKNQPADTAREGVSE